MKVLLVLAALAVAVLSKSYDYSFNDKDECLTGTFSKGIDGGDRILVKFRQPSSIFTIVPDRCVMKFNVLSFTKSKLQVRFDGTRNQINDNLAKLTFYDADDVKASKKIREVSKANPAKNKNGTLLTFTTKGSFLTIEGYRSVKNSKNYNVEITIEPVSGAAAAKWSLAVIIAAALVRLF